MVEPQNQISSRQNSEPFLNLLRARQQTYLRARRILVWQLILTLMVPILGTIIALWLTELRPFVAATSLLITLVDVLLLDRAQRQHLKVAAKVCERFDCGLLELPWNEFVAGKHVEPEIIVEAASAWKRTQDDHLLVGWYPEAVRLAPLHLARIICQRTNLWYDRTLRQRYCRWVMTLTVILVICLFLIALTASVTMTSFVVSFLAPAAPMLTWACREYYRQKDTADAQDLVKEKAETLWADAKAERCDDADCLHRSRQFQDAIYQRRSTSPLIVPFVYNWARPAMEHQMNRSAEEFLREIGIEPDLAV